MIIDSPGRREQLAAAAERLPAHVYELVTDHRLTLAGCNADITAKLEGRTTTTASMIIS